ncbi:MAG: beta-lactamase family protein [Dehalococcoidales bacterium]|nr:beta-lactamase family protein [Dehalococcoidales bacterium]
MSTEKSNWPLPFAEPEEMGVSSEGLSRIRPVMQRFIDDRLDPNLVTMVIRHGKVIYYDAVGFMDMDSKVPVRKDGIYRLWSNTKPITGTATMICLEEGLLNLDDPVSKFIPAFKNQRVRTTAPQGPSLGTPTVPVDRDITVRDCLRNTTGLPTAGKAPLTYLAEYGDLLTKAGILGGAGPRAGSLRETLDALAQLPLEAQPGTEFEYQVGYPIAGVVIEEATGKSLDEFYRERIFKPLGMEDTAFYLPKEKLYRFPTLYRPEQKDGKWVLSVSEIPAESEKVVGPPTYFEAGGGGGGVLSTVADYARFGQMLLNGGELDGVRILSRKSVEIMTSSHTRGMELPLSTPGLGFGMGVGVTMGGGKSPVYRSAGTFGWGGAAGTNFFADPKEDLICICFNQVFMHQVMGNNTYLEDFERLVYQSLM